jgi:hypothetical protein
MYRPRIALMRCKKAALVQEFLAQNRAESTRMGQCPFQGETGSFLKRICRRSGLALTNRHILSSLQADAKTTRKIKTPARINATFHARDICTCLSLNQPTCLWQLKVQFSPG